MIRHHITSCPLCRHQIYLKKQLKTANERFLWIIHGGKILPKWIAKQTKRSENKSKKYILSY
jgi:hypothetical protein